MKKTIDLKEFERWFTARRSNIRGICLKCAGEMQFYCTVSFAPHVVRMISHCPNCGEVDHKREALDPTRHLDDNAITWMKRACR